MLAFNKNANLQQYIKEYLAFINSKIIIKFLFYRDDEKSQIDFVYYILNR